MTPRRLWATIVGYWVAGATVLVALQPPFSHAAVGASAALGAAAGGVLSLACSRGLPRRLPAPALTLVVVLSAVGEEIVWRSLLLEQVALRAGPPFAVATSAAAFGFAHPGRRLQHTLTGLCFSALYALMGGLVAPGCAHAVYNLAVAAAR